MRNNPEKRYPGVRQFIDDLRCSEASSLKVGVVGFCWGAYGTTHLAHGGLARNGKTLIDAAFTAHPSEIKVPEHIEKDVQKAAEILEKKKDVDSEVVIIPNAKHGFAVRGDPDNKEEKDMADQAEDQLVKWFAKYLS
ncbi:hypothetical protein IWW34DRAFT_856328 [Fusarium oxysporum f. sp. albedinis]|nr:hypothetical protein IWW34DRAFT_856328 [Fusarium oxysporum f. sp. albedinis]KAK2470405.1 hypothetical protein H9L39_18022 [Fusarium oxysporum f. sp. albedinis]